jgi:tetratricopeptide (TPR) repeat protein
MPFVKKNEIKRGLRTTDVTKLLVGRTEELHFFTGRILAPEESHYNILSISGQGGVGKTTLLLRFIDEARAANYKDYCLTAMADERQATPQAIMESFAQQLNIRGRFEKALIQYKETLRKLATRRQLNEAPTGASSAGTLKIAALLERGTKGAVGDVWNEQQLDQLLKNAEQLEDPINDLTNTFVSELNTLVKKQIFRAIDRSRRNQRILLFFDTFEQLAPAVVPWLLDYFLQQEIDSNIVLVIAGRDALESSVSDSPKRWLPYFDTGIIYSLRLEAFTQEETSTYLMERGISDPRKTETIWQLSHGLPLYLGLLTSQLHAQVDPTGNVVDNFLRWIPKRENIKRRLALDAALFSRPFNQDDLGAFPYLPQSDDERSRLYDWLTSLPFVQGGERGYFYHELARSLFRRHLYQSSQRAYYATRWAIAGYYKTVLEKAQREKEQASLFSDEWRELVFALALQLFALPNETSSIEAIEYVLYAHEHSKVEVKSNLHALKQELLGSGVGTQEFTETSLEQLSAYIEADLSSQPEDVVAAADHLLDTAARQPYFSAKTQASILCRRGLAYQNLGEYQRALDDFDRMVQLDPVAAAYYNYRGNAHYELKDYQRAILDFQQALQLDPDLAPAYRGLILAQQRL